MNRRGFLANAAALIGGLTVSSPASFFRSLGSQAQYVEGVVFHDRSGTGKRQAGDPGVAGVSVSNGREVVKTDKKGRYKLPIEDGMVVFVVKPSGWSVPVNSEGLPQFHYVHRPNGSPKLRYAGIAPTGNLPASVDFALTPAKESDRFKMILFGDPQPRNQTEIDYIAHDVVEQVAREAREQGCSFGLSLGDEMFDNLALYDSLNRTVGTIGLPWYNTVGNHDLNYDSLDNEGGTETFKRVFGPTYYAFDYGMVHFVVLNDVIWHGSAQGGYHGELTKVQLEWLKNDLVHVPKDRLLFVAMHIPLAGVQNREELFRLIEDRPHTFSVSAHTHVQANIFYGKEEGWNGKSEHHHLNHVTVCGSWWEGAPDERGIPHATMSDGGPNGYSIIEFKGNEYLVHYRPASRPAWEQMSIFLPEQLLAGEARDTDVIVNVFAGSERSNVEMKIDNGEWVKMENFKGQDPFFLKLKELEASPKPPLGLKLPNPSQTAHLWKGKLGAMSKGTHVVEIRTRDMYGQEFYDRRIVRIV